jgi:hypothetical protein
VGTGIVWGEPRKTYKPSFFQEPGNFPGQLHYVDPKFFFEGSENERPPKLFGGSLKRNPINFFGYAYARKREPINRRL